MIINKLKLTNIYLTDCHIKTNKYNNKIKFLIKFYLLLSLQIFLKKSKIA
jgi:hypothetical protein